MLGKTHHAGGSLAALVAFEVLKSKGLLIPDCNEIVQLMMMYPFASFGSIFSDLDHGPDSIPSKDPIAIGINRVLHILGAKHRSWQTHSLLVTGGLCSLIFALILLGSSIYGDIYVIEWAFLRLAMIGFICGVGSHLILDSITPGGISVWPGFKLRFVPKSSFFATGGKWETFIFYILVIGIVVLMFKIFIIDWLYLLVKQSVVIEKLIEMINYISKLFRG